MKWICFFLFMNIVSFSTQAKLILDDSLVQKAKIWYEKKFKESSQNEAFKGDFKTLWEKAHILEDKEVVVPVEFLGEFSKNAFLDFNIYLIIEFSGAGEVTTGEVLHINPRKPILGDVNQIIKNRRSEHISGLTGQLLFKDIFPWEFPKKTFYFYNGYKEKRAGFLEINSSKNLIAPVLEDGTSPQRALYEKHFRGVSGYSIFEFLVREDGSVDSIHITSQYYSGSQLDSLKREINTKDKKLISGFKFQPLENDTWVQCKVYTYYYNNRTGDPLRYNETADHFRTFDYGLKELHQNEIDSYFRAGKGETLEYIIQNGKVIFAPTYIWGIT